MRPLEALGLGASRVGGLPDLPAELAWPTFEGKKLLPFLAQIDLSQLPRWDGDPLPSEGWLYFFARMDLGDGPIPSAVLYHRGPREDLARAPRPAKEDISNEWEGEAVYETFPVCPRLAVTLDDWRIAQILAQEGLNPRIVADHIQTLAIRASVRPKEPETETAGFLLGQVSAEDGSAASIAIEAGRVGDDWRNLLMLESVGSMTWSDCGLLYNLIRNQDLVRGDFSNLLSVIGSAC